MPLAQFKGLSGLLSAEQKGKLIRKVTEAMVVGQLNSAMPTHVNFIIDCMAHGLNCKLFTIDRLLFGQNATVLSQIDPVPRPSYRLKEKGCGR
jgi:phenylpyruvate tautomerase PptA (4-oxalocrotonate tautomerase family)